MSFGRQRQSALKSRRRPAEAPNVSGSRSLVLASLALVSAVGVAAAAGPPHQHLREAEGRCSILGGGTAFYLCPPGTSTLPMMDSNGHVRVTLLGGAKSSNGREVFDDEHGQGQVTLRNGGAFAANGGVLVSGRITR